MTNLINNLFLLKTCKTSKVKLEHCLSTAKAKQVQCSTPINKLKAKKCYSFQNFNLNFHDFWPTFLMKYCFGEKETNIGNIHINYEYLAVMQF